jgi:hypothetical protein
MNQIKKRLLLSRASAAILLLMLAACSSPQQEPTEALQAAELSITNAERARVADHASAELSEAREKLAAAYVAVNENEMIRAQRLAEQARVDAELAIAKSQAVKAADVNNDTQRNINILKHEMRRNNPGEQQ